VWLVWVVLALIAVILLLPLAIFAAVAVGGAASVDQCPRCGVSLDISEHDRALDSHYTDPRYRSTARNHCAKCGWRRAESEL
jgi:primosomal protein N'